jgi:drug/metabolite transporter (DMT)-like permease
MIELFLTYALLASGITTNKVLLYTFSPIFFVGLRMLFAGCILGFYVLFSKHPKITLTLLGNTWKQVLVATLATTFLPALCKSYALQLMPSSKAAFFGTLDPFVTALYALVLWGEKLTKRQFLGIVIGFAGAWVLLLSHTCLEDQLRALGFISYPELAALAAVVIGRYGWITVQQLLKREYYTPVQINTITMLGSGILSLSASALLEQGLFAFTQAGLTGTGCPLTLPIPALTGSLASTAALFIYTVLVGNVISLTLYAHVLRKYSAVFIALSSFSVPLFVSVYGWLFLNETLSGYFVASCVLTFIGLIVFYSHVSKQPTQSR